MKLNDRLQPDHILQIQKVLKEEKLLMGEPSEKWNTTAARAFSMHQRRNKVHFPTCNMLPSTFGMLNQKLQEVILMYESSKAIQVETPDNTLENAETSNENLGQVVESNNVEVVETVTETTEETENATTPESETENETTEVETDSQTEVENENVESDITVEESPVTKWVKKLKRR